jgi:diguanylate cyclase (GGDEF)-like protein
VTDEVDVPEIAPPVVRRPSNYTPPEPAGWSDPLTGADGPRFWDRVLASEAARSRRYDRPATVALIEIVGIEAFVHAWGAAITERTFVRLARTVATEIRSSDHIARIGRTRFAVLLTETDQIAAINFVERVRSSCEGQVGELGIAIGWASPTPTSDLHDAMLVAERRLLEELALEAEPAEADLEPAESESESEAEGGFTESAATVEPDEPAEPAESVDSDHTGPTDDLVEPEEFDPY